LSAIYIYTISNHSLNLVMKTTKLFIAIVLLMAVGTTASAQTGNKVTGQQKTESFKVWGKCDMCKARIENAVKSEGAASASWDLKTKILTVTFDPSKTSIESFGKKLAAVGHDTEKFKADDKAYNSLPGCCKYERPNN
jgi:periplasmic mercuric ion binding protein